MHDVHQLADTFLTFNFRLQGTGGPNRDIIPNINPVGNPWQQMYFFGWRDASQIIKNLRIYSNNAETGYFQRECEKEGLFKFFGTSNEECLSRLYQTTDLDRVYQRDPCCGTYIQVFSNTPFDVTFQVVLPISSLLVFEKVKDIFAPALDITLKFALNMESLVIATVNEAKTNVITYNSDERYVNKPEFVILPYWRLVDNAIAKDSLKLTCTRCTCECYGYTVPPSVKQNLFQMSQQPLVIPCRKLEIVSMPDKFYGESYVSVIHHSIDNVSELLIIIQGSAGRYHYQLCQLYIDGQLYPASDYMQYLTDGQARFAAAYVRNRNPKGTIRTGLVHNIIDTGDVNNFTEFSLPFQLKRNNNYDVYDGKDSGATQVALEVRLQCNGWQNEPGSVELWLIRDCAWILDANGLRFVNHPGQVLTGKELGWITHRPEEPAKMRNTQH